MARVKPSQLAGLWYERTAAALERQTDALLAAAPATSMAAPPGAVVVPHAAYQYSGATAAAAYRCVRGGPYRRALILAPSHYHAFRGAAFPDVSAFATPLGEITVDRAALDRIADLPLVRDDARPFEREHALEIQLPLLQRVLPQATLVPLLLGSLSDDDYEEFALVIERLVDAATLIIVSSDFTHYGARFDYLPFPPTDADSVRERLRQLDMGAITRVLAGDRREFGRYVAHTGATICGRVPIAALLAWHGATAPGVLLAYTTSADLTGDFEHSVSYAALAFARK